MLCIRLDNAIVINQENDFVDVLLQSGLVVWPGASEGAGFPKGQFSGLSYG